MTTDTQGTTNVGALTRRLIVAALLLLVASVVITSHAALEAFERQVRPEIGREAAAIGKTVAAPIERALSLGVPFAELDGVPDYLKSMLPGQSGVAYLVVTDAAGAPAHSAGPAVARFVPVPGGVPATLATEPAARDTGVGYDTALPLRDGAGQVAGWLHVGMSREPLDAVVRDARWDVVIVLLVGMLLAVEILRFVVRHSVSAPAALMENAVVRLSQGDFTRAADTTAQDEAGRLACAVNVLVRRLSDRWDRLAWLAGEVSATSAAAAARAKAAIADAGHALRFRPGGAVTEQVPSTGASARLTLFLFVTAEQLSTSFIPLYGLELARDSSLGWGPDVLAAIPIATFVAGVALVTPFGGRFAALHGPRQGIVLGALPALAGFIGSAFATNIVEFSLARALCGAGYAIVTISCQAELARAAAAGHMARSLGSFTSAVMTGAVCGTAIGAVLADRLGYAATFLLSAGLAAAVQLVASRSIAPNEVRVAQHPTSLLREAAQAMRSLPFTAMVVLTAIPAKLVLAGFVFYTAPVALRDLGFSQPAIGRVVMLYGLCMLPAIALGAWLSDRARMGAMLMVVSGAVTGAALLLPLAFDVGLALPVAVALVGVLQGLASAPMLALAPVLAAEPSAPPTPVLLAFLRLSERVGSAAGPMLAAYVMTIGGTAAVMLVLGVVSLLAALAYAGSLAGHQLWATRGSARLRGGAP